MSTGAGVLLGRYHGRCHPPSSQEAAIVADLGSRSLEILEALARQPATSYYEGLVAREVGALLEAAGIPVQADAYGNLLARYTRGAPPRPVALVAHMDHPGFELLHAQGRRAVARALGRSSEAVFHERVPLRVIGRSSEVRAWTAGRAGAEEDRRVNLDLAAEVTLPAFAVFDMPAFVREGEVLRMRAADDLAGCAAILAVLEFLAREGVLADVIGVFTRAEEDGLIGARLLAAAGALPREALVVSVESSRVLPGAEHGRGPVVRVGDATTTFSAEAEALLLAARRRLAERQPPVPVQRQLMSGGTCEASAFLLHGYRATGIAFPLGHYHNGFGEDRVEPEFIYERDFLGGVDLLREAVRLAGEGLWEEPPAYARLRTRPEAEARRLQETARA